MKTTKNTGNKNKAQVKQTPTKQAKKAVSSGSGFPLWLVKNICAVLAAWFFLSESINGQHGYKWAYHILMKSNMAIIREYPHLTLEQKNAMKLGSDYAYLQFMKNATPEDAVILYPSREDFFPKGVESPFKQDVSNKLWALRVLYPRKLVTPSEMETSRYAKDITHVAIVNGKGYERLGYNVKAPVAYAVVPVKR
ncbi:MAG: hypothetical protein LBF08_04465 [Dysgonamonadaceae bacterium]|jgi:hypothetical protein|nr:hypothetical protein [Dysgonamonadaceae bacterium]